MKRVSRLLICAFGLILPAWAQNVITTFAGQPFVFRGDGRRALDAPMGEVTGIAVDALGNYFIADYGNHLVHKVSTSGILTVVAGNGIEGYSGDGGQARNASLRYPLGVALDSAGNLYIADSVNNVVRRVAPDGVITTIAGTGRRGYSGDGGLATDARLSLITGVAADAAGNVYITDRDNQRIRRVSPTGIITTVAGTGIRGFSGDGGPATGANLFLSVDSDGIHAVGLTLDAAGNLYIPDRQNHRVRRVTPDGIITTFAGNGVNAFAGDGQPATSASLTRPVAVAADGVGNLYIVDQSVRVRRVNSSGTISTVTGNGSSGFSGDSAQASSAVISFAQGIATDHFAALYIADTHNYRVRKVAGGIINTIAGNGLFRYAGDGGPAVSAALNRPNGVALDSAGNVYVADTLNDRVRKIDTSGIITTVAGTGSPGFSGDGGPATAASLNSPYGVAVDAAGNLYIADTRNDRIRKVSAAGIITTFAGRSVSGFSGDGGPAASAALRTPIGVATDAAGNVYIVDRNNHRTRKVTPAGIITTVAGNGLAGFSGDGGPATQASLALISSQDTTLTALGVAVDANGNLYIADRFNHRIRQVSPAGIISTFAGTGGRGFSGDGGPARVAVLEEPRAVALDSVGNVFISDADNNRIRKVSASGIITTFAGNGSSGSGGDGGPATAASVDEPHGIALDSMGSLYIAVTFSDRIRKVLAAPPALTVSPLSLRFTAQPGEQFLAPQRISIETSVIGLVWSATVLTPTGGNWLSLTPTAGTAPGSVSVSVNAGPLGSGVYRGQVTILSPLAVPASQTVSVELVVLQAAVPELRVDPAALLLEAPTNTSPVAQTLRIINAGSGSLAWVARAESSGWLSMSPTSGSAAPGLPSVVEVTASPAGLAPGVYSGSIRVESVGRGQSQTIAVTLLHSQASQTILLSQTGLLFTGVEGGSVVPSQSFGILNTGQGAMNWTVEARTLSGGSWLSVSPSSGRSDAASLQVPLVDVVVNVTGLRAGQYSGLVRINAPLANNSPQFVTIEMTVLPAGSNPGVLVRPTGLIFAAQAGTTSPGSQTVRLASAAPGSAAMRSGLLTFDGSDWLEAAPRNAVITPAEPQTLAVQPTLGTLAPGIYRGALTLLFGDGSPTQTVNNLFLVTSRSAAAAAAGNGPTQPCHPQRLLAVHRTLGAGLASPVGWPSPIEVQVLDDCGAVVPNANVVVSFSNGDLTLVLASLRNGIYTGTWRPVNAAGQTTVTARAAVPGLASADAQTQVQVSGNPMAPALFAGGVVNGASFARGSAVAPGAIVSVFGRNLTRGLHHALQVPLETTLGGVTMTVGGQDVPLFFSSDGQINAQLPFELASNSRQQVVVRARREDTGQEVVTVPETITVAASQPGIFSTNQQGTGQGAILDAQGRLVAGAFAATPGSIVQVFCTGLGATEPRVLSGRAAPADPLSRVVGTVEARIGDRPAVVHFAGLAPGFVGLYQVNIQVPEGVTPGPEVPLVILHNGVPSNTVTLAIR